MKIYLDLDGVMADFERHFEDYFGAHPHSFSDKEMWKAINGYEDFYANLPLMPDARELFIHLDSLFDMTILTACPRSNYKNAAMQKRQWVYKHLSPNVTVIPMMGGKNKCLFMHSPQDILIDDFESNCVAWEELGGLAIVHKSAQDTIEKLNLLLR